MKFISTLKVFFFLLNTLGSLKLFFCKVYEKEFYEPTPLPTRLNCLDVCNHIKDCPLCSKFYHNDNTLFIIIIVCLLILTVILTRKVLNL